MDLVTFMLIFLAGSAFWAWIVFGDGAERLEGTFASGLLLLDRAPDWPSDAIRMFAIVSWLLQTAWFAVGLFIPTVRPFGP